MREELIKLHKKIGQDFLDKIDEYKEKNNISYNDIAKIVGINRFYFGNLRNKIKKNGISPSEKLLIKFEKAGII